MITRQPPATEPGARARAGKAGAAGEGRPLFADDLLPDDRRQAAPQGDGELIGEPRRQRCVVEFFPGPVRTEDERQDAGGASEGAAIEDPLADIRRRAAGEAEHRQRQRDLRRKAEVDGGDRFEAVAGEGLRQRRRRRMAGEQRRRMLRADGEDGAVEGFPENVRSGFDAANPAAVGPLRPPSSISPPFLRMKAAAAAGSSRSRSVAGSSRSVAARPLPRLSRRVLAKIWAEAFAGGVFSAARQSASQRWLRSAPR